MSKLDVLGIELFAFCVSLQFSGLVKEEPLHTLWFLAACVTGTILVLICIFEAVVWAVDRIIGRRDP